MLKAIGELGKMKSKDLGFIMPLLKIKNLLEAKNDEFKEISESLIDYTDDEKELMEKAQKLKEDEAKKLEAENPKLTESIFKKQTEYMGTMNELMEQELELELPSLDKEKFPENALIEHYEVFYELIKD